jgi:hypothetical protein
MDPKEDLCDMPAESLNLICRKAVMGMGSTTAMYLPVTACYHGYSGPEKLQLHTERKLPVKRKVKAEVFHGRPRVFITPSRQDLRSSLSCRM